MRNWHWVTAITASLSTALLIPWLLARLYLISDQFSQPLYFLYAFAAGTQYRLLGRSYIEVGTFEQGAFFFICFMLLLAGPITVVYLFTTRYRRRAG